jgi:hypothetical protein
MGGNKQGECLKKPSKRLEEVAPEYEKNLVAYIRIYLLGKGIEPGPVEFAGDTLFPGVPKQFTVRTGSREKTWEHPESWIEILDWIEEWLKSF